MISEVLLQNLTVSELTQQKDRFSKRNNEIKKMNQYLTSENREMEEKNEILKKTAERLIKISNEIVVSNEDKKGLANKINKIFSPLKDKIKVESYYFADIIDNNKRAIVRNIKKTQETFNVLKENFNEMIMNKCTNENKGGKKKIFDVTTLKKKSFEANDENIPKDITHMENKSLSSKYIEEISFEFPPKINNKENLVEQVEKPQNEEIPEKTEIEKNEI